MPGEAVPSEVGVEGSFRALTLGDAVSPLY